VAKKRKPKQRVASTAREAEIDNPTVKGDVRWRKALILGALTGGGVFQMNSWQAQACGNRSSHRVAIFQTPYFSPNDYVLMRQGLSSEPRTRKVGEPH
jgi:hypothetical protein